MTNDQFDAWSNNEHAEVFDYLSKLPNFLVKYHFERYNEMKLLKQNIHKIKGNKLYEIGCATGELFRYYLNYIKRFNYLGFDISPPAIKQAHLKYPKDKFILLTSSEIFNIKLNFGEANLVWSRDVVMHQSDPYQFIKFLIDLSSEAVIIRLRTRDVGQTVFDVENSCQLHWDKNWAPYIVLNTDELINQISSNKEVNQIFISRNYQVLGGHNYRYLPKELYFKHSKTAETAILILKGKRNNDKVEVVFNDYDEKYYYSFFSRAARKIFTTLRH